MKNKLFISLFFVQTTQLPLQGYTCTHVCMIHQSWRCHTKNGIGIVVVPKIRLFDVSWNWRRNCRIVCTFEVPKGHGWHG